MSTTARGTYGRRLWRFGGLCLALLVIGAGGAPLYAQEQGAAPDTGRTAVPPAAPPDSVTADDVGPGASSRAIVEADSLSALVQEGERLQELFDNVQVQQDSTRLRSNFALRYLDRDVLLFTGDVVIYERGDTLRADTVRYNKRTKVGRARSNVRLTDGEVVVRSARATYFTQEKRTVFPTDVTLVDSTRVLRAESGTYWSEARRAEFQGNVRLTDPDTRLTADSLTYYRDRERSIARGQVTIRRLGRDAEAPDDSTTRTYLFGQWADNQEQNRFSRVEGQALLVRIRMDSTGAPRDTLVVRGRRLDAYRTDARRRLVAIDSVRIWEQDLAAVADSAVYDRLVAADTTDTLATPSPVPGPTAPRRPTRASAPPDSGAAGPDTTTAPSPDSLASADSTRTPEQTDRSETQERLVVRDTSRLPLEETRLFQDPTVWFENAQVWGDSIRVRAHRRSLDTVFVRRSSFAAQRDSALDRIQQLKGTHLTALFRADSLRRIEAGPNAEAIRFLKTKEKTLKGAAKTSGDRIVLRFRNGEVRRTSVIRGVQSTYYRTPEDVPTPFHLEGFQWTPERRPTKPDLIRTDRARALLESDGQRARSPGRPLVDSIETGPPRPTNTAPSPEAGASSPAPTTGSDRRSPPSSSSADSSDTTTPDP